MSLLCVCVKQARLIGNETYNTYVCLKLQNFKSKTIAAKGLNPSWEQDFMFETQRIDVGLTLELWNKGILWDKLLGTSWLPLSQVQYSNQEGNQEWISMYSEILMQNGVIVGTQSQTGNMLLVDCRFKNYGGENIDDDNKEPGILLATGGGDDDNTVADNDLRSLPPSVEVDVEKSNNIDGSKQRETATTKNV